MKRTPSFTSCLLLAMSTFWTSALAQNTIIEDELRRQLQERDAEISSLKQQLNRLRAQPSPGPSDAAPTVNALSRGAAPSSAAGTISTGNTINEDDELASALESSLVRQGGAVLQPGTVEIEPELSYFYDELSTGQRRDGFGTAVSLRYGLPAALQADMYLPYVIRDHQAGVGSTSGLGDVRLGLTKQLAPDRDAWPALLVSGHWRVPTGDIDRMLPTGFGQHALQLGLTATKRLDPVLLFGSLTYTANLGSAQLRNGTRINAGNVFGVRLGANLAATPETSFYWGVSYNSSSADRFNGERVALSDHARGFLELGSATTIGHAKFLNLSVGVGVTPAAPRFSITASLPFRF